MTTGKQSCTHMCARLRQGSTEEVEMRYTAKTVASFPRA